MTEKRFQYNVNKNSIEYNEKHFAYCNVEQNKIANRLNELNEEKEYEKECYLALLKAYNYLEAENQRYSEYIFLEEENERLKRQKQWLGEENKRLKKELEQLRNGH